MPERFQPPFTWNPGEHVAVIGQTQSGKSTLVSNMLSVRRFWVAFKTKGDSVKYPADITTATAATLDLAPLRYERILLRPKPKPRENQKRQISLALEKVWEDKGWTVYIDELFYLTDTLKIVEPVERLLTQGASTKITVMCSMQRPSRISRFAVSESTHVIGFYLEGRDRKIIKEAGSEVLAEAVYGLQRYQFAWLYRPTREVWTGRYQDLLKHDSVAV